MSVYLSIRLFRHILTSWTFSVLSDHHPLSFALVRRGEPLSPRLICQLAYISEFTDTISFVLGDTNVFPDALSRDVIDQLNSITSISMDKFANAQKTCPDVKKLISSSSLSCSSRRVPSGLVLHTGMSSGRPRIIVPKKLRE